MSRSEVSIDALAGVIDTLESELSSQRDERAREQAEHARERDALRGEIARLVAMVEGVTRQLDELLRDRDDERRAKLAELREEAQAMLAARAENEPKDDSDCQEQTTTTRPNRKRDNHGRKPIPENIERDTTRLRETCCPKCSGQRLSEEKVLVSEEWDYVRAHLRVRRTERVLDVCQDCNARVVPE